MPPKSKKQQQEQAKRLEEQRKRKEEEERAAEIQRKKYASEIHETTGLVLPVTQLFLEQFPNKATKDSEQLLRRFLDEKYPTLKQLKPEEIRVILDQFNHNILFVLQNYIASYKGPDLNKRYQAARVAIGILFSVFASGNSSLGSEGKSKESDFKLFCQLIKQHSLENPAQGKCQLLTIQQAGLLIKYARMGYFAHHRLIFSWQNYNKKETTHSSYIYVDRPCRVFNNKETPWTDLSQNHQKSQQKPQS